MFNISEIIDLAVQIEENGKKIYLDALESASDEGIRSMLQWLAEQEEKHVEWFSELRQKINHRVGDPQLEEMGRALLKSILGDQTFSLKGMTPQDMASHDRLFTRAVEFENDTIVFYEMMQSFVEDEEALEILEQIVSEEKRHVEVMQDFVMTGEILEGFNAETPSEIRSQRDA